jgi:hypothetical protein
MTEAPEKIWAGNDGYANRWDWDTPNDWPEYTRSDIAQAKAASLEVYIMQMEDNLYKLEAEVARLKAALYFYAEKAFWHDGGIDFGSYENCADLVLSTIEADNGETARAALEYGETDR